MNAKRLPLPQEDEQRLKMYADLSSKYAIVMDLAGSGPQCHITALLSGMEDSKWTVGLTIMKTMLLVFYFKYKKIVDIVLEIDFH